MKTQNLAFKDGVWCRPHDPRGGLSVVRVHRTTGRRTLAFQDSNLVVDNAKEIQAKLLAGLNDYRITEIAAGTGEDPLDPDPPLPTDTSIADEEVRMEVDLVLFPSDNSVLFRAIMGDDAGNGMTFTTAGLVAGLVEDASKQLFAKRNHLGVPKDEEFLLEYNWTIVY